MIIPNRRLKLEVHPHPPNQNSAQSSFLPVSSVQRPRADATTANVDVVTVVRRLAAAIHGLGLSRQAAQASRGPAPSLTFSKHPSGPGTGWGQQSLLRRCLKIRTQRTPSLFLPFSVLTLYPGCGDVGCPEELWNMPMCPVSGQQPGQQLTLPT